jgi:hypothetical protein
MSQNKTALPPAVAADSWCRTRYEDRVHHIFVWTIEQFSQRREEIDEAINSATFTIKR